MNKANKIVVSIITGISFFAPVILQNSNVASAKETTWGNMPKWVIKAGEEGNKENQKSDKEWKKQSDEFAKTHDKNIEYDLDGSIPKDPNNVAVAKKYKKELPKLEKKLKSLKQGTTQYKSLNHEIKLHKTAIKAIFG